MHRLVCIGDLHGQLSKLRSLMEQLQRVLGKEAYANAEIVFLGDYVGKLHA
jgi:hypothetical protein